jgi:hypothetical protein
MVSKAPKKNFFLAQTQKKILLKIRLILRVRNFTAQMNPKMLHFLYFNPNVAPPIETYCCKNHKNH